jgi:hypothetical protein
LGGTITSHDVKKVSTCLSFSHFTFSALFLKPESLALQSALLVVESTGIDSAAKRSYHFIFAHHSVVQSEMNGEFLSSNSSSPKIALILTMY